MCFVFVSWMLLVKLLSLSWLQSVFIWYFEASVFTNDLNKAAPGPDYPICRIQGWTILLSQLLVDLCLESSSNGCMF